MADRSLTASFGANTAGFTSGIEKVKRELTELNAKLSENKQKVKEANKEISALGKRQSSLASKMAGGGSDTQKKAMEDLKQKIAAANEKLGQLKATESELKAKIAATNGELKNQVANMDSNTKSTGLLEKALGKLGTTAKAFISIYGAKKLWDVLIGSNAEMEQYQTSFEVMLGDAEKTKKIIEELRTLAANTPLAMSDVISTGTLLMNYGVSDVQLVNRDDEVATGILRKETTVNVSCDYDEIQDYALKEAEDKVQVDVFEMEVQAADSYKTEWFIGDIVTFKHGGLQLDSSITQVEVSRTADKYEVRLTAGENVPTTIGALSNAISSSNNNKIILSGSSGVGKFTNAAKTSEIFNDYTNNTAEGAYNHTAGLNNKNSGNINSICGGTGNSVSGQFNSIGGGTNNKIESAFYGFIGSGQGNTVKGSMCGILNGSGNLVSGQYSAIVGGQSNKIENQSSETGQIYAGFIGGGSSNQLAGQSNAIVGGISNKVLGGSQNYIGGGSTNSIVSGNYSAIAGGLQNQITRSQWSFIGAALGVEIEGDFNFIGTINGGKIKGEGNFLGTGRSPCNIEGIDNFVGINSNGSVNGNYNTVFGDNNKVKHSHTFVSGNWLTTDRGGQVLFGDNNSSTDGKGVFVIARGRNLAMIDENGNLFLVGNVYTGYSGSGGGDDSAGMGYTGNVEAAAGKTLVFENGLLKSVIEEE